MNFDALEKAVNIAISNKSVAVVDKLHDVLGQLLNAAVKSGDKECAVELIKAGASVEYQKNNFEDRLSDDLDRLSCGPYVAFNEYAANIYVNLPSCPSWQDVIESFKEDIDRCRKCCYFMRKGPQHRYRAQYMESLYFHYFRKVKTPLLLAVEAKDAQLTDFLLQNGAQKQVDCGSFNYKEHVTPFSTAVFSDWLDGIELFILHGLDVNKDIDIKREIVQQSTSNTLMIFLSHGLLRNRIEGDSELAVAAGKFGRQVPKHQQEAKPCSLKFTCRTVIRDALAKSSKENFFITVTKSTLHLPRNLCEYILCGYNLLQ